ncbi:hypothetical protein AJ78_04223 [Emergomyces pasteurianus Ep9510]|uniref:DUF7707 domain-containing protein n=1 Tax=Emergomyces pasteurianus Ep9510 TaxID=1447872 RepID=A0A1J9QH86_9EURO|nr:hypothetical protein AJ78_04223 [Emergomyces pasteurianus Ep9510]
MLFPTVLLALSFIAGFAGAQSIDPSTVPKATREAWCRDQTTSCPLLCMQNGKPSDDLDDNKCDPETLIYICKCSNGLAPNASEYSQTIPYYICTEANNQCVRNCNGDTTCQTACRVDNPCGAQNPKRVTTTATTATKTGDAAGTGTNSATGVVYTGLGDDSATPAGKGAAGRLALQVGQVYGVGVVVAGFLAGFSMLL